MSKLDAFSTIRCGAGVRPAPFWFSVRNAAAGTELALYDEIPLDPAPFIAALNAIRAREITLRISSPGGWLSGGMVMMGALQRHPARITARVEQLCASAATLLLCAADRVEALAESVVMVHEPTVALEGADVHRLQELLASMQAAREGLLTAYEKRTKAPRAGLEPLVRNETWMSAGEARELGFVDSVIAAPPVLNCAFDLSGRGFQRVPAHLRQAAKPVGGMRIAGKADKVEMPESMSDRIWRAWNAKAPRP